MRLLKSVFLATTLLSSSVLAASADVKVVASVKPVHSLVAAVMEGVGSPALLIDGAGSPHTYSLKPSQAQQLEDANLVFWIGHDLETFLEKPLEAIATKAKAVELIDAHELTKLEFREGGGFDEHDHGHEGEHAGHDDHAHDDHAHDEHEHSEEEHSHDDHAHETKAEKDHDHDEHAHDDHAHDEHEHSEEGHSHDDHAHEAKADKDHDHEEHAHEHGAYDPHVWLDPENAKALVHEIEEALAAADPENAKKYEANALKINEKLDALIKEISTDLAPAQGKGFVVFHDAYQYFEKRFGLSAAGSITVSPEVVPGAERISEIREKVKSLQASCVFSEPQFEPKLIATVTEGTDAKTGVLDPLGTSIENGPDLYFTLIRNMARSFKDCLSAAS